MKPLEIRLLDAHEREDKPALVALYTEAANVATEDEARGFYLTHAYVFALEINAPEREGLRSLLKDMGRI